MSDKDEKFYEKKLAEYEDRLAKEKEEREKADEALKKFRTNELKKKRESHESEIKTFAEKLVKDGRMTPAYRDNMLKDFEKLPYDAETGFALPLEFFKTFVEEHEIILDKKEYGKSKEDTDDREVNLKDYRQASREVDRLAQEYQRANPKLDYNDALDAIIADPKHAEVVNAYLKYDAE